MNISEWTPKLRILNHVILLVLLILLFVAILIDHSNLCREHFRITENQKDTLFTNNHKRRKFYKRYKNKLWDPKAGFIERLEKHDDNSVIDTTPKELPRLVASS